MGLDMYLRGEEHDGDYDKRFEAREKGTIIQIATVHELGYWRKHPNLHGYIVNKFADEVDECQRISLSKEMLLQVLEVVEKDELPSTSGFFFGVSSAEDKPVTIRILKQAIEWLESAPENSYRDVYYQASW